MVQPVFSYTDPVFSRETAADCSLFLLLAPDGLGCIVQKRQGNIMLCHTITLPAGEKGPSEYENKLRIHFGAMPFLNYSYAQSTVVWGHSMLNLVPKRLFDPQNLPVYFTLLCLPGDVFYAAEPIPALDTVAVYAWPNTLEAICRQYLPQAQTAHLGARLLAFWQQTSGRQANEVLLNIRSHQAQMAVFERRNLLYYNTFEFQNDNDALYFVLLAYEQFRLIPEETPLILSGQITEGDAQYKNFARYIRHIQFAQWPDTRRLPQDFYTHQTHTLIDMLCLLSA